MPSTARNLRDSSQPGWCSAFLYTTRKKPVTFSRRIVRKSEEKDATTQETMGYVLIYGSTIFWDHNPSTRPYHKTPSPRVSAIKTDKISSRRARSSPPRRRRERDDRECVFALLAGVDTAIRDGIARVGAALDAARLRAACAVLVAERRRIVRNQANIEC